MGRKIVVKAEEFGSLDFATATEIVTVDVPTPGADELVLKVSATGIEASDVIQMAGGYGDLAGSQPTPSGDHDGSHQVGDLGCEGVGVVIARGSAAMDVELGQAVAFMGYGLSFREFTTIKAGGDIVNSQIAFPVPDASASWVGVPCSALTATGGLELEGKLSSLPAGSTVLVTGAAGGTGHIAVQWAAMKGMRVAGTCGDEVKAAMLRELGCDVVVNYRTQDVEAELAREFPDGFMVVYEGVGGQIGDTAQRLLASGGTLVSIGAVATGYGGAVTTEASDHVMDPDLIAHSPSMSPVEHNGKTITGFFMPMGPSYEGWEDLKAETVAAVAEGRVRVMLDEGSAGHIGLEGVYAAQARMRLGVNSGKIYTVIDEALCRGERASL